MPILKPISGHTGCRNVRKYLEKNGRAIARDFFNLSWDEREMSGYDQAGKEAVEWDREMDRMRASFGNDAPCKGRKARTYKHFVISPDPEDGIDIEADAGTQVLAASSGTVLSVADDDLMGTTVVIAHDGGYETTYSNLQSVPTVAPEQYVSAGQVIGAVGTTSLAEASMSPHLHFSVTKDGEIIDPQEFLKS